jgi:dolichol-phosphate mannosyltransferase
MIQPGSLDTIVVIPTYNEAGNIESLILELLALNDSIGCIVVDDDSVDGTSTIVRTLAERFSGRINLVVRNQKRGRATAGIRGHQEAIKLKPTYVVEMDADFSHDPKYIEIFLCEISDCDVVVGSRFVPGGKDSERGVFRRCVSVLSGHVFRLVLGIKVKDIGSGFKLYRRGVLESLPWQEFLSSGLAISMEEIFRIARKGYRIKEVAIIFRDRQAGYSKVRWKDFLEPLKVSLQLVIALGRG